MKTISKHKSLFCLLPSRPTSQFLQRVLQAENWLTWALGRRSPDTTGRIYSSVCDAAPLGLQHWKHRQVVEDKAVNTREGNNEDWPGGLRETIQLFPLLILPRCCCWVQSTSSDLRWKGGERQMAGNRNGRQTPSENNSCTSIGSELW